MTDGRIVILNAGSRALLFYTADGEYLQTVGGDGRGPGEFRDPTWLGRANRDTLFVWDAGLARLSTLDGTGDLLSTRQVGFAGGAGASITISGRFGDGSFLSTPGPLVFLTGSERIMRFPETYQRYDPETDTTTYLANGQSMEMVFGAQGGYSLPFGKRSLAVASENALLVADNGIPELRVYQLQGRLARVVKWASEPIRVTARDKSAYAKYVAAEPPRTTPLNAPFANDRPRFSTVQVDRSGWIWVREYAAEWESPAPWLVFDGEGVLRCEVTLPDRIAVLEIGPEYILALRRDELGEERVVRFALKRALETASDER